jgi:beta-mannosidase
VSTPHEKVEKTIGFRTIEVDTSSDMYGIGMTFIVNNTPIFAKGANWIVIDALPGRYSKERYEDLLLSVVSSHMNMVRVWGGGHYENDIFYDLCDQLGILVWQDCMFSCSLYPATSWFLKSVKDEITYQVKRLKDHPSLALWCGNNEDVGALTWFESSRRERDKYLIDYDRLNEGIIGKTIKELDPLRKWWSSSPSAGESDYSDCWHDDSKGDMHYWSVWHEGKPFEAYKEIIPRFCSEFGFQSFPSLPLLTKVITHDGTKNVDSGEFNLSSSVMEHHQRNDRGNTIILSTMLRYFHLPSSFAHQIYISQIQQSFAMQTAIEYWRSNRPRCMGTLFWQLQDNWPVASWSSIEYGGKWKALQYEAKRFYNPLLLTFQKQNEEIALIGVNDNTKLSKGSLTIQKVYYKGKSETLNKIEQISMNPQGTTTLYKYEISSDPSFEEYCLYAMYESENGEVIEGYYFPTFFKTMNLSTPTISIVPNRENEITSFTITSNKVALYVCIDHPEKRIQLDDNFFHLMPHQQKTVCIENGALSKQDVDNLVFTHLRETY